MLRLSTPLFALAFASTLVVGCGGASGNDFESGDASAGEPAGGGGGKGGSGQGGSGGTSSGSGGSSQGGSTGTGGASGTGTGGESGTDTGGASGTANGGTGGTDPIGGTGSGGAGQGGAGQGGAGQGGAGQGGAAGVSGRAGSGGQGGNDCNLAIQRAQAALNAAQLCNPLIGSTVCTGTVEDLCGCQVPVADQNSEATKNYLTLREPAVKCGVPCLAVPCMEPTAPMCGIAGGVSAIVAATTCRWGPR